MDIPHRNTGDTHKNLVQDRHDISRDLNRAPREHKARDSSYTSCSVIKRDLNDEIKIEMVYKERIEESWEQMAIIKERTKKEWREFNNHAPAGIGQVTDMFERSTIHVATRIWRATKCMARQATMELGHYMTMGADVIIRTCRCVSHVGMSVRFCE